MTTTTITVVGNLTADPDIRYTPSGVPVANFRVASTPSRFDRASGGFVDGETIFMTCSVWRTQAENVANTLRRGDRVVVTGKLKARSYTTNDGDRRTVFEVDVEEVGPSLRYATAEVTRTPRPDAGGSGPRREPRGPREPQDPWAPAAATGHRDPDPNDPWAPRRGNESGFVPPDQDADPPF